MKPNHDLTTCHITRQLEPSSVTVSRALRDSCQYRPLTIHYPAGITKRMTQSYQGNRSPVTYTKHKKAL